MPKASEPKRRIMSFLSIVHAPDPRLKAVSEPVANVDDALRQLMDDMLETMYEAPGVGLSAIQVNVPKRLIVLDVGDESESRNPLHLINPEIIWHSEATAVFNEGCLSLPEQYAEIERPAEIRVRYIDYDGKQQERAADGILARCIQHEYDHLDGILFVDHLSAVKRSMILRKLVKAKRLQATA